MPASRHRLLTFECYSGLYIIIALAFVCIFFGILILYTDRTFSLSTLIKYPLVGFRGATAQHENNAQAWAGPE